MNIHAKLTKILSWPIPYWLTPIGLLVLVGIWQGFNWKLNTDNWPFWIWALDKLVTGGIILGSALFAQSVFNRNAIRREDADRRINGAIDLSTDIKDYLDACILKEGNISKMKDISNLILEAHSHITAVLEIHDFKIGNGLNNLMSSREKLNELILNGEILAKAGWPEKRTTNFIRELSETLEENVRKSLKSIRIDLTDIVKDLRKQQLSQPK